MIYLSYYREPYRHIQEKRGTVERNRVNNHLSNMYPFPTTKNVKVFNQFFVSFLY